MVCTLSCVLKHSEILLSDTELFFSDDGTVAVDVYSNQIIEEATTLTYQFLKSACCTMIFVI